MANLLINTTVGGNAVITTSNIGSYALTSLPSHTHDDRYYTEGESDGRYAYKAGAAGQDFSVDKLSSYHLRNHYGVSTNHSYGMYFDNDLSTAYAIFRESGAWDHPYPDLRIAFHTGIKLGANSGYQGIKFYTDYDMVTQVMSVNNGSDPLGAGNVYVNNSLQAGSSLRAPIFYDSNDTTYYGDFAGTSNLYNLSLTGAKQTYLTINPGNGYEAMVRYIGGSGSGWYVGKRMASQVVGTESFHFFSEAAGATVAGIDTGGNFFTTGYLTIAGTQLTGAQTQLLKNTLDITSLPYKCDIYVEGNADTFYPVHFIYGNQDVWRRIIINRGYSETAPWDPTGSGSHKGGLLLDWEGNFGGWGGAEYADRLRVFNESYTNMCADMYIYTHSMGYVFMLRGGHAIYHIFSDQPINGTYQSGSPDIAYSTATKFYDGGPSYPQYDVYAPAPLALNQVNSSRIDGLRTKKQSLLDGRYLRQGVDIGSITNISASNFIAANAFYLNGQSYYLNSTNGGIYTNARFETASNLVVGGNSYLGNASGDETHINDILRVGATDSGDAHFYFGEGSLAGSDYGSHWHWDSGYRFTWNTRNNGTDTALFYYDTNSLSYITWNRSHNINANSIDYTGQLHFNGGTRFNSYNTNYLYFQTDSTSVGGIIVRDGNASARGYSAYFDSDGFGLLNSSGSWGIRLNPGNVGTELFYAGNWRIRTRSDGAGVNGNLYTDQNYGYGLVGVYSSTRYQGVFAMSDSYKLLADGTGTGNLYGIAWTHTNVGGESKSGLGHQALFMDNGTTQTAVGSGIWTNGLITSIGYGTSSNWNTAFGWGNHASAGYITSSGNISGYAMSLNGYGNQTEHTVLTGPANGPVIKVRYDGTTANRYIDIGYKDGYGVYSEGLKIYNGSTLTFTGYTIYHSGNIPTWNQNTTGTASNITAYTINQNVGTASNPTFATVYTGTAGFGTGNTQWTWSQVAHQYQANSIRLWDQYSNYGGSGNPTTYGTIVHITGRTAHLDSQFYLGESGQLLYRSCFYGTDTWDAWQTLITSSNYTTYTATAAQGTKADTAHGWGNHASAGYLTSVTNISGNAGTVTNGVYTNSNSAISGNNHITFGPNSTWSSYLRVGGDGRTVNGDAYASMVTTNGNLHLDGGNSRAIYLNYYAGTSGTAFGNGATGIVAWMGPDGDLWKGSADNSGTQYVYNSGTWSINVTGNAATATALTSMNISQFTNNSGYITGYTETDTLQSVTSRGSTTTTSITADRFRGNNTLVLNTFTTVNPASNVFLYSQPNDRDSWIYLDSADTGSNWGIYHRQIDSAVGGMEGNSIGFIGGGASALRAYIGLSTGNGYFAGTLSASNFSGTSSGTNTGDQTNISGNAATATYATTAGSAPNAGNVNDFYNVTAGNGYGLRFWNSDNYKISMGVGALYQYGPVTDYSIKTQMNDSDAARGFTWGRISYAPIAALNSTSGDMEIAGYFKSYGYRSNSNVGGVGSASWHPDGIYCGSTMWQYGSLNKNNTGMYGVSEIQLNAGLYLQTYNDRNLIVKGNSSSDAGIEGRNAAGNNVFQIYGSGSDYGFLNGTWAAWDIRKTKNAAMYMNNDSTYYLYTNSTSNFYALNIQGNAVVHAGNIASQSVTYATTAGSAPNASNLNASYGVTAGAGNGLKFWGGSDGYKIHMGNSAEYHYGPVTDYSIKTNIDSNGATRGFTWGTDGGTPIAALNVGNGNMQIAGTFTASNFSGSSSGTNTGDQTNISGNAATATNVAWTGVTSRPTALSQFTNDLGNYGGWITGINSGNVTTALGFTPYNATNPSGYISSYSETDTLATVTGRGATFSSNITSSNGAWIKFSSAAETDSNDGKIGSGVFASGLNIVGAQTSAGLGRQIRLWGSVITSAGDTFYHSGNIPTWNQNTTGSAATATSATSATQLSTYGTITSDNWNTYFVSGQLIASSVNAHSGSNRPTNHYDYGAALSYGVSGGALWQMYFPENSGNSAGSNRNMAYRTGWNGTWGDWRSPVNQIGQVATVAGSNGTGVEIHSNVGYNQNPLTYFLLRGQADSSWKTFKILLTGDAGGQDIEFRRIAENSTDARMFYVPRGLNQVIFDYTVVQPSDSRLKDNLTPITNPVDKIKSLRGVEFDWNSGEHVGTHDVGLIAQDVEAVLPEAVTTQEDGYKNLAYTKVIPLLVEAMKEQQTMIEALRAEIELLKNK